MSRTGSTTGKRRATNGMTLDVTYAPPDQIDDHALSGVEEVTVRVDVFINDPVPATQIFEAGASGNGCILYKNNNRIVFQGGDGSGAGSGNSAVELRSPQNITAGKYDIEVSYSVSQNQASLFINGDRIENGGPGDGTTLDPIAGGNLLTVNDPDNSQNGVCDNSASLGQDSIFPRFADNNDYLSDLQIYLDETQIKPLSRVSIESGPFVTTWETTSSNESIFIPTDSNFSPDYDFVIDWGDGAVENIQGDNPNPSHTYADPGRHTVKIFADSRFGQAFPQIYFNDSFAQDSNTTKIQKIDQWGDIEWSTMERAFTGASNLTYEATDTPDLSNVTSLELMLANCSSFNGAIGDWDTSNVTNMARTFVGATSFNQSIDDWDVSSVTDMGNMFEGANSFNQDLNSWDTSSVTDIGSMFKEASNFNGDISNWDTSAVTIMRSVFRSAGSFNSDIGSWNVSSVQFMNNMFNDATSFNQDISGWDTSSVTVMLGMFNGASSFNQPIGSWNVSSVQFMSGMFRDATSFNQPLDNWNVSSIEDMSSVFDNAASFNQDLNSWDTSNVTDMRGMFLDAVSFNGNISSWNVSNVTDMIDMFRRADSFNNDISSWNTGSLTMARDMFNNADVFNQDISSWDVSSLEGANRMFEDAIGFNQDLRNWDVSSLTSANNMFNDSGLTDENAALTVAGWVDADVNAGSNTATDLQTGVVLGMTTNDYNNFGGFEVDSGGTPTTGQEGVDALCSDPPNWTVDVQNAPTNC